MTGPPGTAGLSDGHMTAVICGHRFDHRVEQHPLAEPQRTQVPLFAVRGDHRRAARR